MHHNRKLAIGKMNLHRGDTMLELESGTGEIFLFLLCAFGTEGGVIDVDSRPASVLVGLRHLTDLFQGQRRNVLRLPPFLNMPNQECMA